MWDKLLQKSQNKSWCKGMKRPFKCNVSHHPPLQTHCLPSPNNQSVPVQKTRSLFAEEHCLLASSSCHSFSKTWSATSYCVSAIPPSPFSSPWQSGLVANLRQGVQAHDRYPFRQNIGFHHENVVPFDQLEVLHTCRVYILHRLHHQFKCSFFIPCFTSAVHVKTKPQRRKAPVLADADVFGEAVRGPRQVHRPSRGEVV